MTEHELPLGIKIELQQECSACDGRGKHGFQVAVRIAGREYKQGEYDSEWRWKPCSTCKGSGKELTPLGEEIIEIVKLHLGIAVQ
jgi:RecJ-like exonuclease